MMKNKEYSIPFTGLKLGKHGFKYEVDNTFFEEYEYLEFNDARIELNVILERLSTVMELELNARGTVNLDCDLTSEPYDQEIVASLDLVVKFGEEYNNEDDEILIIPHREHETFSSQLFCKEICMPRKIKFL